MTQHNLKALVEKHAQVPANRKVIVLFFDLMTKLAEKKERMEAEIARKAGTEIVSMELREAIDACGRVTGRSVSQDLLETVFSRFCIGK